MDLGLYILYLILLTVCFILSLIKIKGNQLKIFPYLLFCSLVTEITVSVTNYVYKNHGIMYLIYQIYIPIEFLFLIFFLKQSITDNKISSFINWTILFFFIADFILIYFQGIFIFPGHILNLEGIIISILACNMLLNLPIDINTPIHKVSLLWISLGLLTYYSSSFIFNGLYNYLFINAIKSLSFLQSVLMMLPNYLLYLFISIGILCSNPTQK
ncbi:hypothetical protein [Arcicella lustrica]|uniref:Uncharacterized protein n=1 Tax=Arcicella lustrica TaxID=2984196 RepID=A0ABU5SDM5_9BACT|nr:hypothetical protein [Arcicella sp. DC25W]MEA5425267.1 hypothetical protein [Arcicella sp. DC25W]